MNRKEILLEEFKSLRTEITQSINKQHQILLSGYSLSLAVVGYVATLSKYAPNTTVNPEFNLGGFIAIPLILLAMSSLWIVECNRMVRASYYIGFELWPKLSPFDDGWEKWIRLKSGTGSNFRKRQHWYQSIVVVVVPCILSGLAVFFGFYKKISSWELLGALLSVVLIWIYFFFKIKNVSDLAKIREDDSENDR